MVDGHIPATPTAHVQARLLANYPDAEGEIVRGETAHTDGRIGTTEPGS